MTVKPGEAWGWSAPLPGEGEGVVLSSDAGARVALEAARAQGHPFPTLGLVGGDLCRTLGGGVDPAALRSDGAMTFPVDLGEVVVDGRRHLFMSHAIARSPGWGRGVAAMNAPWVGDWNLGPKAHPGDGLLDVVESTGLGWRERLLVRQRLATGSFLPHRRLRYRRTAAVDIELARPLAVWVDGERIDRGRRLSFRVEPDALRVVVCGPGNRK